MKKFLFIILSLLLAVSLCSCTGYQIKYIYPDGDNYTFGTTTIEGDKVKNIEIDWLAGSVNIKYSNTRLIDIYEADEEKYASEQCLHWWLDGDTLRIHFSASLMIEPFIHQKDLIITLPEEFQLSKLRVNTTSADILCNYLNADNVLLEATSGDIELTEASIGSIEASSSSGVIKIGQKGVSSKIEVESTSGNTEISADEVRKLEIDSTSGDVNISCLKTPAELEIDSTSGNVSLKLPEDAGFTAEIETSSGDFLSDIPVQMKGERYIAGDGRAVFDIETTSGSVTITK